ncbi:hypothetical protein D3C78_705580 [compost metagenome]
MVEAACKQIGRRTNRLRRINHNNVVRILMIMDMHKSIIDKHFHARVVELASNGRQIFFRIFNNLTVDVDKNCLLHLRVLHNLANNTAVAAAYYKHVLRIRVSEEHGMRNHFMVYKFILHRRHYHAVQHKHRSELFRLDHIKLLKVRLFIYIRLRNLRRNAEALGLFFCIP